MADAPRTLTVKERAFAIAFARTGNATQAARDAGYKGDHGVAGSQVRRKPHVADFIRALLQRQQEEAEITVAGTLKAIRQVAELAIKEKQLSVARQAYKDILDHLSSEPIDKPTEVQVAAPAEDHAAQLKEAQAIAADLRRINRSGTQNRVN